MPTSSLSPPRFLLAAALLSSAALIGCGGDDAAARDDEPAAAGEAGEVDEPQAAPAEEAAAAEEPAAAHIPYREGPVDEQYAAIASAADRTDEDREKDGRRHPAELLTFLAPQPGWHIADLGAGGGYTTELLARAVGADGVVYGQNTPFMLEKFVGESWPARLSREQCSNVKRIDSEFDAPWGGDEVKDLDAVTIIFTYHDTIVAKADRAKMNAALFEALKPGGVLVLADHNAAAGAGIEAATQLHRLEESIVRQELEAAGFVFDAEAQFLRDASDPWTEKSFKIGFKTDRYLLRYKKP